MAEFTKGLDLGDFNDQLTADRLNAMMDDAMLVNVKQADMASGVQLFNNSEPGSPSAGDNYVDSNGNLELYFDAAFRVGTYGAEPVAIEVTNSGAFQIEPSDVVIWDPTQDNGVKVLSGSDNHFRVVGVAKDQIAPAASGDIYIRGIVPTQVNVGVSDEVGDFISGPTGGRAANVLNDRGASSFGWLLESNPGVGTVTAWCYIWR